MAILYDISNAEYHASTRVSNSKLQDFVSRGPRLYHMKYVSKTLPEDADKEAFVFGTAFEDMVCGKLKLSDYLLKPTGKEGDGRTVEGKAWREANGAGKGDDWKPNKPMLSQEQLTCMEEMNASLREHQLASAIMYEAKQQVTLTGELYGVEIQARPDFLCDTGNVYTGFRPCSLDLKTTKSMNGMTSAKAIVDYGYEMQAAFVHELCEQNSIANSVQLLLPVEKSLPHRCELIEPDEYFMHAARKRLYFHMRKLSECVHKNEWPRSSGGIIRVSKPAWYKEEKDDE
jgi:hypothetical protein